MERGAWLTQRRAAVRAAYDAEAPSYADDLYPADMQRRFVDRLLTTCPPGGLVLDAPCGTGRYFAQVVASGRRVVGIDQSAGMLEVARARGIAAALYRTGLQELDLDGRFDGVMTIDAMENVAPEEWPSVLANLHRAMQPTGHLYLTVEEVADAEIDASFDDLRRRGLPTVRGEVIEGDVAGYHFYPARDRVAAWLAAEGLEVVADATEPQDGWAYWHLLLRST